MINILNYFMNLILMIIFVANQCFDPPNCVSIPFDHLGLERWPSSLENTSHKLNLNVT